jgi:hypothetical protein
MKYIYIYISPSITCSMRSMRNMRSNNGCKCRLRYYHNNGPKLKSTSIHCSHFKRDIPQFKLAVGLPFIWTIIHCRFDRTQYIHHHHSSSMIRYKLLHERHPYTILTTLKRQSNVKKRRNKNSSTKSWINKNFGFGLGCCS